MFIPNLHTYFCWLRIPRQLMPSVLSTCFLWRAKIYMYTLTMECMNLNTHLTSYNSYHNISFKITGNITVLKYINIHPKYNLL